MAKASGVAAGVALVCQLGPATAGETGVPLVTDGASNYRIVLGPSASASEQHAARELQTHVRTCSGCELPIVSGTAAGDGPAVVVGCGDAARGLAGLS